MAIACGSRLNPIPLKKRCGPTTKGCGRLKHPPACPGEGHFLPASLRPADPQPGASAATVSPSNSQASETLTEAQGWTDVFTGRRGAIPLCRNTFHTRFHENLSSWPDQVRREVRNVTINTTARICPDSANMGILCDRWIVTTESGRTDCAALKSVGDPQAGLHFQHIEMLPWKEQSCAHSQFLPP